MEKTIFEEKDIRIEMDSENKILSPFAPKLKITPVDTDDIKKQDAIVQSWIETVATIKESLIVHDNEKTLFDRHKTKQVNNLLVPANWETLCEDSLFWKTFHVAATRAGITPVPSPDTVLNLSESQDKDWLAFCNGLALSLDEAGTDNMNHRTTSSLELARLYGQRRRVLSLCAAIGLPLEYTKHGKFSLLVTNSVTDPLVKRIMSAIPNKEYGAKLACSFASIYSSAQAKLAVSEQPDFQSIVMSFEETWNGIANAIRSPNGKVKFTKGGRVKKYHPKRPKFNGMTREEITKCKVLFAELFDAPQKYRDNWLYISGNVEVYLRSIKDLLDIYKEQVEAANAVKNLSKSRLEALNLRPNASKSQFLNRKAQREAEQEYNPVFSNEDLAAIADYHMDKVHKRVTVNIDDSGFLLIRKDLQDKWRKITFVEL